MNTSTTTMPQAHLASLYKTQGCTKEHKVMRDRGVIQVRPRRLA